MWRNKSTITIGLVVALVIALGVICYLATRSSKSEPNGPSGYPMPPGYPRGPPRMRGPPRGQPEGGPQGFPRSPPQGHPPHPQGHPQGPNPQLSGKRSSVLVLFHDRGCGHCKQMMAAWHQAAQVLRQSGVQVEDLEYSKHKDIVQRCGVQGFPTIRLYPEGVGIPGTNTMDYSVGKFVEYRGNRTAESLIKFARSGGQEA